MTMRLRPGQEECTCCGGEGATWIDAPGPRGEHTTPEETCDHCAGSGAEPCGVCRMVDGPMAHLRIRDVEEEEREVYLCRDCALAASRIRVVEQAIQIVAGVRS